jgi:hypothetical protein
MSTRFPTRPYPPRGFEIEPSDEWREDYGRGGPVRSDEPERDWFFERNAAPSRETRSDAPSASKAAALRHDADRGFVSTSAPTLVKPVSYRGLGPKGYTPRDERLYEIICERLTEHPAVDARQVSIAVDQGVVTVSGSVPTRTMKHLLEDAIAGVYGVVEIRNEVKVISPTG